MNRRVYLTIILGLAVGLLIVLLTARVPQESEFTSFSSPLPDSVSPLIAASSPLAASAVISLESPLELPPTAPPPVTTATLEAIRATRPTATPLSSVGVRVPYISPATWRGWALRILAAAGVLAYIGFRLRKGQ